MKTKALLQTLLSLSTLLHASSAEEIVEAPVEPELTPDQELLKACMTGQGIDEVNDVKAAIAKGADVNTAGENSGQSPFMAAVLRGKIGIAKYLHSVGADITKGERSGYTAAHGAAFQGRVEMMQFLIEIGVDIHAAHEGDEFPPFIRTCWGKEERHAQTLQLLIDQGVDPTVVVNDNTCEEMTTNEHVKKVLAEYKRGSEL